MTRTTIRERIKKERKAFVYVLFVVRILLREKAANVFRSMIFPFSLKFTNNSYTKPIKYTDDVKYVKWNFGVDQASSFKQPIVSTNILCRLLLGRCITVFFTAFC